MRGCWACRNMHYALGSECLRLTGTACNCFFMQPTYVPHSPQIALLQKYCGANGAPTDCGSDFGTCLCPAATSTCNAATKRCDVSELMPEHGGKPAKPHA